MVTSPQARAVRSRGQFPESSSFFHWSATSSCAICSCTMSIASSREMKPLVSPRFAACVGHPAVGAGLLRAPQLRPAVQVVPGSADRRPAFDLTTFTKNRERLLGHEIADRFFAAVVRQAELRRYVTSEHFSVDGTLLGAWAHTRAWRPRTARSPPAHRAGATAVDFRGGPRNTRTHRSTTDPEALLARRVRRVTGQGLLRGAHPHGDRSAPIVDMELTQADGVGRTGGGRPDAAQAPRAQAATDRRCRQGLRYRGIVAGCRVTMS